jgi:hypothetical protein
MGRASVEQAGFGQHKRSDTRCAHGRSTAADDFGMRNVMEDLLRSGT